MNVRKAPIHQKLKELKELPLPTVAKKLKTNALLANTYLTVYGLFVDIQFRKLSKKSDENNHIDTCCAAYGLDNGGATYDDSRPVRQRRAAT